MSPTRVEKPWGHELIWAHTDRYVRGEMKFIFGSAVDALEEITLGAGQSFHVYTGLIHRMVAVTDCDILEASTPDLDDVVRLEDRYGRA